VVKALVADDLDRDITQVFAEARILEELEHPAIIRLRDCDFVDPVRKARPYLVMDYFEGATLEDYVQEHGSLSAADWLALARPVADGLQAAHAKGILHRDVKPANLLVRREPGTPGDVAPRWRVKLIDFGLALRREARHSTVNTGKRDRTILGASIAGTLDYAAPEQMGRLPGVAVGPYSDLYGFGKTCCYALFKTAQPAYQHWRKLPEPVAELIGHCIAEAPDERPPTFAAILDQLEMREATPIVLEAVPAAATESASAPLVSPGREVVLASLNAKVMQMMRWVYLGLVLGGILGMVSSAIGNHNRSLGTGGYWSATTEATGCLSGAAAVWSLVGGICLALAHYHKRKNATPPQTASVTAMCFRFLFGAILGGASMGLGAAAMGYATESFVGTWLGVSCSAAAAGLLVGLAVTSDFERALRVGMLASLLGALIVVMTYFINAPAAGAVVAGGFGAICAAAADILQRQYGSQRTCGGARSVLGQAFLLRGRLAGRSGGLVDAPI
jgi:tRNA A-37 threonylcarbamoyl transferase component Bud32